MRFCLAGVIFSSIPLTFDASRSLFILYRPRKDLPRLKIKIATYFAFESMGDPNYVIWKWGWEYLSNISLLEVEYFEYFGDSNIRVL